MMGAGNVRLVFVYWGDLPGGPFRLLIYMALRARDNEPAPQFWAGREELALALGRVVPPPIDETSNRTRNKHFKAVKDATSILLGRGAVSLAQRPAPGRNAVYALHLAHGMGHQTGHGNRAQNGARKPSTTGHGFRAQRGTVFVETGHENRAPEEEEDESGLRVGRDSEGSHHSADGAHARANQDQHSAAAAGVVVTKSERDALHCGDREKRYAAASAVLARREDLGTPFIEQAQTEMPDADWADVVIRAAHIFTGGLSA
jgi:hypothetical protein